MTTHLPAPHRRDGVLGGRLRAGDHRAAARSRDRRRAASITCSPSSASSPQDFLRGVAREPASRLLERARDAAGDPPGPRQGLPVRRRPRPAGRVDRRRRRALPPLRRLGRAQLRHGHATASIATSSSGVPRLASHRQQDRLPDLLGAADLRRRLLPRGAHALRRRRRAPNLHYCEWIRGWTDTCLEIYGELAVKNPGFLRQFDGDESA